MKVIAFFSIVFFLVAFGCGDDGREPTWTVYLKKPVGWGVPYVIFYIDYSLQFPVNMTALSGADAGWYKFDFYHTGTTHYYFKDRDYSGHTLGCFTRTTTGWYTPTVHAWSNTAPAGAPAATGSFAVHFKTPSEWGTPNIWFWNDGSIGGDAGKNSSSWPGNAMTAAGNGWYTWVFSMGTYTELLFNNGNANLQTSDLCRTNEGWFNLVSDGGWTDTKP